MARWLTLGWMAGWPEIAYKNQLQACSQPAARLPGWSNLGLGEHDPKRVSPSPPAPPLAPPALSSDSGGIPRPATSRAAVGDLVKPSLLCKSRPSSSRGNLQKTAGPHRERASGVRERPPGMGHMDGGLGCVPAVARWPNLACKSRQCTWSVGGDGAVQGSRVRALL